MTKRASRSGQDGRVGETSVKRIFEQMGWGPVPVTEHDDGSDSFVQVRDGNLFELGLLLGVQVKNEKTYFKTPGRKAALSAEPPGWHYKARSQDDVAYWLDHTVPHILVLYDRYEDTAYWVEVTRDVVTWTKKGAKIWVPVQQELTPDSREELLKVAAAKRLPAAWSGSMWDDLTAIAPADRLRYAMLTPRIAAPHLNRRQKSMSAEETIASLLLCRFDEIDVAESRGAVPGPDERPVGDYQWRLLDALAAYVRRQDLAPLILLAGKAGATTPSHERAATVAAMAACLAERGDHPGALAALAAADVDMLDSPLDRAWLLSHQARSLLELGRLEESKTVALEVAAVAELHPADPTALTLKAAALNCVVTVADRERVVDMIRANDSAPAWWRGQQRAWALSSYLKDEFERWAGGGKVQHSEEAEAWQHLRSLMLTSGLAADLSAWRTATSQLCQFVLMMKNWTPTTSDCAVLLSDLCRAGDSRVLRLAATKLADDGPCDALTIACADLDLGRSAWTSRDAAIELASLGSDLMVDADAERHARWALAALQDPERIPPATQPAWVAVRELIGLVASLWERLPDDLQGDIRAHLAALAPVPDQLTAERYTDLVRKTDPKLWSGEHLDEVRARLSLGDNPGDLKKRETTTFGDHWMLGGAWQWLLAAAGDGHQNQRMLAAAATGAEDAILAIGNYAGLPEDVARGIIGHFGDELRSRREDATYKRGASFGLVHGGRALVQMNVAYPQLADWDPIVGILEGPALGYDQTVVLNQLPWTTPPLTRDIRDRLVPHVAALADRHPVERLSMNEVGYDPDAARRALFALQDPLQDDQVLASRLAAGGDGRRFVARAVGFFGAESHTALLCSLAGDTDPRVRQQVAGACVRWLFRDVSPVVAGVVLDALLGESGTRNAFAALRAVPDSTDLGRGEAFLSRLAEHPSTSVRSRAQELMAKQATSAAETTDQSGVASS